MECWLEQCSATALTAILKPFDGEESLFISGWRMHGDATTQQEQTSQHKWMFISRCRLLSDVGWKRPQPASYSPLVGMWTEKTTDCRIVLIEAHSSEHRDKVEKVMDEF